MPLTPDGQRVCPKCKSPYWNKPRRDPKQPAREVWPELLIKGALGICATDADYHADNLKERHFISRQNSMAGKVYGLTKDGARYLAEQRASESKSPDTIKLRQ